MATAIHNMQSVKLGTYATIRGERELHAVRVDGEVTIFDMLAAADGEDRDERVVEDGLTVVAEIHALARDYLERAARFGRPQVRAL